MARRFEKFPALFVNRREIKMRVRARLVTRGVDRLPKPAHAIVIISFGDQITADVVVGISETRIDCDRRQTFGNGAVILALKTVGPAQKGVSLGGWGNFGGFF